MNKKRESSNLLIVEGRDDLYSVAGLMRNHTPWPSDESSWPVLIKSAEGVDEILKDGFLSAEIKASAVRNVGVMLDADSDPQARYLKIKSLCEKLFPGLPDTLPSTGLVAQNEEQKRLGLWIMPDNLSAGYLENFLSYLVPSLQEPVWQHAVESVSKARGLGASCKEVEIAKANLHTWLAWQSEPGRPFGIALTAKVLDPGSPNALPFVTWFKKLYDL